MLCERGGRSASRPTKGCCRRSRPPRIGGSDERTLRVIGVDALREGVPQLLAPDKVLLSPLAAAALGEGPLRLVVGQHVVELEVAGGGGGKGLCALTDISTAQWRLGRLRELTTA